MERSEPALVPEWLRCTGNVGGGSPSSHHFSSSSLHSGNLSLSTVYALHSSSLPHLVFVVLPTPLMISEDALRFLFAVIDVSSSSAWNRCSRSNSDKDSQRSPFLERNHSSLYSGH